MKALTTVAALGVTGIALAACGGSAASNTTASDRPASCSQQFETWKHGPARAVAKRLVANLRGVESAGNAEDIPRLTSALSTSGKTARELQTYPMPHCADPKGYYHLMLVRVVAGADNARSADGLGGLVLAMGPLRSVAKIEQELSVELQRTVGNVAFDGGTGIGASRIPATTSPAQAAPTSRAASPAKEGNISLAPSHMPPGPFKITPLSCKAGKGLTFRYSNESNDLVGAPFVTVDFLDGSRVVGSNENFGTLKISPGQNATDTVAPTSSQGQTMRFQSCEVMGYSLSAGEPVFAP